MSRPIFRRSFPLVSAAALLGGLPLGAASISPNDLFLAPASVPNAMYDSHMLTFGTSTRLSEQYTTAELGGAILGAQILPVLNPDPNSSDGSYSSSDLAAISVHNYPEFFFREPGTDYTADLTSGVLTIDYKASGQYLVRITAQNGGGVFSRIFDDQVDDFFMQDPPKAPKDESGPSRRIDTPNADLVLVSTQDPGYKDGGVLDTAAQVFKDAGRNVQRVDSLTAAKNAIQAAFKANGNKKISVIFVGHGRPGSIKIGTQRINNDTDSTITPAAFQSMIDQWVKSIEFDSCNTGQNSAFLQTFTNSLGQASGYKSTVTFAAPSLYGFFSGYVDLGAGSKKLTDVATPEPSTGGMLVFVSLLVVLGFGMRARRRTPG